MRHRPFLDIKIVDFTKCPKIIRDLNAFLLKEIGQPCDYYAPSCVVCENWIEFYRLDDPWNYS